MTKIIVPEDIKWKFAKSELELFDRFNTAVISIKKSSDQYLTDITAYDLKNINEILSFIADNIDLINNKINVRVCLSEEVRDNIEKVEYRIKGQNKESVA